MTGSVLADQGTAPAPGSEPVLAVRGLRAWIGTHQILHEVAFEVPPVGVTALLGRNGVGKTTTLRAVLGLIRRTGSVTFGGEPVDTESTHRLIRRGIGYVPENRDVFARLSVEENLALATLSTNPRRELIDSLFPELRERSRQLAGTLSGGQQQMVALARALLNENALLLVDEPTKGLAPRIVENVMRALEVAAGTAAVLLVEQDLRVVERVARQVVVMAEGRVVHTGPTEEFLSDPALVRRLLGVHRAEGAR